MYITVRRCLPFPKERHETAWQLFYDTLLNHYGISREMIEIAKNKSGKPYLKSHPQIHFSLSHAEDCVACVIAERAVGIDCERIRPISTRIRRKILQLRDDVSNREAIRAWTRFESKAKCLGIGIFALRSTEETEKTEDNAFRFYDASDLISDDYIITVCLVREDSDQSEPQAD